MSSHKRYAIVGTGNRSLTYIDALCGPHRDTSELVALVDPSPTRIAWHNQRIAERHGLGPVPAFSPHAFETMIRERQPDEVIVTTPDYTHHDYILRALAGGCHVITEKPMTIDRPKLRSIFDAIARTGRRVRVTFNARYIAETMAVRKLVLDGAIGTPLCADLNWFLDTSHGADYFRRWHREKEKSGGLLVHKASHHFDLINWWIDSFPQHVFAFGGLKFYGRENAATRGEHYDYDRYTGTAGAKGDPFAISLDQNEEMRGLYLSAERDTGYLRDRNVFGDGISIEDTVALCARYQSGVPLSYSLVCYSPWEGYRAILTGTKGRIELNVKYGAHITRVPAGREAEAEAARKPGRSLRVYPMFGLPYDVPVEERQGSHDGADELLMQDLFSENPPPDPLGRRATHIQGAAASLIGICANESMETGMPADCEPEAWQS